MDQNNTHDMDEGLLFSKEDTTEKVRRVCRSLWASLGPVGVRGCALISPSECLSIASAAVAAAESAPKPEADDTSGRLTAAKTIAGLKGRPEPDTGALSFGDFVTDDPVSAIAAEIMGLSWIRAITAEEQGERHGQVQEAVARALAPRIERADSFAAALKRAGWAHQYGVGPFDRTKNLIAD